MPPRGPVRTHPVVGTTGSVLVFHGRRRRPGGQLADLRLDLDSASTFRSLPSTCSVIGNDLALAEGLLMSISIT